MYSKEYKITSLYSFQRLSINKTGQTICCKLSCAPTAITSGSKLTCNIEEKLILTTPSRTNVNPHQLSSTNLSFLSWVLLLVLLAHTFILVIFFNAE